VLLFTYLVGIEVTFLILLVLLSIVVARMLIILFKLRTATWGLILGRSASFGSLSTPVDTAWVGFTVGTAARALFTLGGCTVLSDTLGGDAPLFGGVVLRLVDDISVKASIAAFNLLPVLRKGLPLLGSLKPLLVLLELLLLYWLMLLLACCIFPVRTSLYLKLLCLLSWGYRNPSAGSDPVLDRCSIR
jgi:hypothetical protein